MTNKSAYGHRKVVESYATASELYAPEQEAIRALGSELQNMRMLDIGIGGGRTTAHFAPLVHEYVGVDYSPEMIGICRERFPDYGRASTLKVCDARSMQMFSDDYFDFVLFSFNGIDYAPHPDRIRILQEILRVSRDQGLFVFSAHNLNSDVPAKFALNRSDRVGTVAKRTLGALLFRVLNPHWFRNRERVDFLVINDGAHRFRLRTYYVNPRAQVEQLLAAGFRDVRVLALDGGVLAQEDLLHSSDPWLHYFATAHKPKRRIPA